MTPEERREQAQLALETLNAEYGNSHVDEIPPATEPPSDADATVDETPPPDPPAGGGDAVVSTDPVQDSINETLQQRDPRDEELASMRQLLDQMQAELQSSNKQTKQQSDAAEEAPLYTEDELEEAMVDPKKFGELLNRVHSDALSKARTGIESVRAEAPSMAIRQIQVEQELIKTRDAFYATNPDLVPYSQVVGLVADKIQQANPNLSVDQFMSATATAVRKMIPQPQMSNQQAPAFANTQATRQPAPQQKPHNVQVLEGIKKYY